MKLKREKRWRLGAAEGAKSCKMLACVLLSVNKTLCYLLVVFEWLWKSFRMSPKCRMRVRLGIGWKQTKTAPFAAQKVRHPAGDLSQGYVRPIGTVAGTPAGDA